MNKHIEQRIKAWLRKVLLSKTTLWIDIDVVDVDVWHKDSTTGDYLVDNLTIKKEQNDQ